MGKQIAWNSIDDTAQDMIKASDLIWEHAEIAFLETESMKTLCELLRKEGFEVEEGTADIATAFKGTFGSGKPVIGFLGEFDALSGLSQVAGVSEKQALVPGDPGHGCGHNLLGVGALSAAIGEKKYLEETGKSGTVVYFGCPAEEGGSGKAFMAKKGIFEGLDAAITWHPGDTSKADTTTSLANYQVAYKFYGTSAHAGTGAHRGRSALDALELMNMGVKFLREHIIPEARIHYAITDTGGHSPNVVQSYAEVLYLIRAPKNSQLEEIYRRVNKIAEGAALMTETRVEIDFVKGCSSLISNRVIARKLWENLHEVGAPEYTEDEIIFAEAIQESVASSYANQQKGAVKYDKKVDKQSHKDKVLHRFIMPFNEKGRQGYGSTDVGDVSWNCPTAQIYVTTWAAGTPSHSWQAVSQGKSTIAHKGMLYAAKVMAGAAIDLIGDPSLIEAAKAELMDTLDGESYVCPIPDGCKPRTIGVKK